MRVHHSDNAVSLCLAPTAVCPLAPAPVVPVPAPAVRASVPVGASAVRHPPGGPVLRPGAPPGSPGLGRSRPGPPAPAGRHAPGPVPTRRVPPAVCPRRGPPVLRRCAVAHHMAAIPPGRPAHSAVGGHAAGRLGAAALLALGAPREVVVAAGAAEPVPLAGAATEGGAPGRAAAAHRGAAHGARRQVAGRRASGALSGEGPVSDLHLATHVPTRTSGLGGSTSTLRPSSVCGLSRNSCSWAPSLKVLKARKPKPRERPSGVRFTSATLTEP